MLVRNPSRTHVLILAATAAIVVGLGAVQGALDSPGFWLGALFGVLGTFLLTALLDMLPAGEGQQ